MNTRTSFTLAFILLLSTLFLARAAPPIAPPPATAPHFVPVDVFIDSGPYPLAAYQFELTTKNAQIVGLEGGDSVFHEAPYYDPAALHPAPTVPTDDRIIVAAFSTADTLPKGPVRVARLHLLLNPALNQDELITDAMQIEKMPRKLIVATDATGAAIDATISLRPFQGDTQ